MDNEEPSCFVRNFSSSKKSYSPLEMFAGQQTELNCMIEHRYPLGQAFLAQFVGAPFAVFNGSAPPLHRVAALVAHRFSHAALVA